MKVALLERAMKIVQEKGGKFWENYETAFAKHSTKPSAKPSGKASRKASPKTSRIPEPEPEPEQEPEQSPESCAGNSKSGVRRISESPPSKRKGAFSWLDESALCDTGRLLAWHRRASACKRPVVGKTENDIENVVAAAERAIEVVAREGGNEMALFAAIVGKKMWDKITGLQAERARVRIREFRRQQNGHDPDVTAVLAGIGTGGTQ